MIVWLNGGFGAGKTTLADELRGRIPGAVVYNPEDVGQMLWRWLEPGDDFQDLASWRELVVATARSLRAHHAQTLIVPMALIRDAYREEILGALAAGGEPVLHVFLDCDGEVLKQRIVSRAGPASDPETSRSLRAWAFSRVDAAVAAAGRQPDGTLMLRSDTQSPAELADAVLAAVRANTAADEFAGERGSQAA